MTVCARHVGRSSSRLPDIRGRWRYARAVALVHGAFRRELHNAPGPAATLEQFRVRWDEHLADEECNIVPLINGHLTPREWRQFARFELDGVSAEDRRRFLANVPPPQRIAFQLFGGRSCSAYRAKLYVSPIST